MAGGSRRPSGGCFPPDRVPVEVDGNAKAKPVWKNRSGKPQSASEPGLFGDRVADRCGSGHREEKGPYLMAGRPGSTPLDYLPGAFPSGTVTSLRFGPHPVVYRSVMCGTAPGELVHVDIKKLGKST